MEALKISGGRRLKGNISVSGSKNASLPILAATLLSGGTSRIYGVPHLRDIRTMLKILAALGAQVRWDDDCITVNSSGVAGYTAPYELVKEMRASICLLGPLLSCFGKARISLPGGCVIGDRPVDIHIKGLEKLGVDFKLVEGYIEGKTRRLTGASIFLGGNFGSSVLATANLMMAACFANGETVIEFAACEPEIVDLTNFLNKMGAKISGAGSHLIRIKGVKKLKPTDYRVIPDRIEAGTHLLAGAITAGEVEVHNCIPEHLFALLEKLVESGAEIKKGKKKISIKVRGKLKGVDIVTLPYPGFPTDLQAQFMSLLCLAEGTGLVTEKVFPERFMHVAELKRLGADITLQEGTAIIRGREKLAGTRVMASDLRASAALVLAGLAADGETIVSRIYHLDRGYQDMEGKLNTVGAKITPLNE